MIEEGKVLVMDVDGTLCPTRGQDTPYPDLEPHADVVARLREYREQGFYVVLQTSRQMRTHQGNVGRINATTLPELVAWLDRNDIPYDEIHVGKPWAGREGFYVDDRAIRPDEFVSMSHEQITDLLS